MKEPSSRPSASQIKNNQILVKAMEKVRNRLINEGYSKEEVSKLCPSTHGSDFSSETNGSQDGVTTQIVSTSIDSGFYQSVSLLNGSF